MSSIDPAKLKVVELRAELTARGLDAKGNKPVLVKRLKDALEQELQEEIPDTSIADTSTEDLNTTQESVDDEVQTVPPDKKETTLPESKPSESGDKDKVKDQKKPVTPVAEKDESKEGAPEEKKPDESSPKEEKPAESLPKGEKPVKSLPKEEKPVESLPKPEKPVENLPKDEKPVESLLKEAKPVESLPKEAKPDENVSKEVKAEEEPSDKKPEEQEKVQEISENGDSVDQDMKEVDKGEEVELMDVTESENKILEQRGEKRRRSPSPEKVQRKRSKSPIKENEPTIDNNKVQLSWYDSDLHLQIDKKTFLSGKPYHEGAFGYAWAGVRATHGVKAGKVWYEVKITEELKWEDLVKQSDRRRDHRLENTKRDRQRNERDRSDKTSKSEHSKSNENKQTDVKNETENKTESEVKNESEINTEPETKNETEEKIESENKNAGETKTEAETKTESEIADQNASQVETVEMKSENEPSPKGDVQDDTAEKAKEGTEAMVLDETPTEPMQKHLLRVGWSMLYSSLQLGEAEVSYAYESTGKYVTNNTFAAYGAKFGVGDVVGAYLNITDEAVTLNFTVNGELQPEIASIPRSELPAENFALFPHILVRNCVFEVNMGASEEPWCPSPASLSDYTYILKVDDKVEGALRPETRSECEVIMMCGLPASGKTHWVQNMLNENSDKRYTVIGNSHFLDRMTVNGKPLKNSYKGRWSIILDRLMKCVNILVEAAALRRRNFIIDQTNVFPSAQRRKMRLFEGFKRRAVVVVVGDDEQAKRRAQQEAQDGKDVPDSAILEMKANMCLPRRSNWLEEVTFVELNEEDATAMVQKYNQQGRDAGFGPLGNQRSGGRDNRTIAYRWDHSTSRRDYRGGYRDNRHHSNRYDRSRQHGNWQNRRPPPGSWNRDIRRDSRGSSRDYRNNNRSSDSGSRHDRSGSRDNRNRNQSGSNYNRSQRSQSSRNQPANWQGSGNNWQYQGNWSGQGMWNQGNWGQGNWSGGGSGQWKANYGQGGYGQSGYGNYSNWNYYGEYPQNWNSQGQPQTTTAGGTMATDSTNAAYNQYSQQAAWAQYAQQYTQDQPMDSQQLTQK